MDLYALFTVHRPECRGADTRDQNTARRHDTRNAGQRNECLRILDATLILERLREAVSRSVGRRIRLLLVEITWARQRHVANDLLSH